MTTCGNAAMGKQYFCDRGHHQLHYGADRGGRTLSLDGSTPTFSETCLRPGHSSISATSSESSITSGLSDLATSSQTITAAAGSFGHRFGDTEYSVRQSVLSNWSEHENTVDDMAISERCGMNVTNERCSRFNGYGWNGRGRDLNAYTGRFSMEPSATDVALAEVTNMRDSPPYCSLVPTHITQSVCPECRAQHYQLEQCHCHCHGGGLLNGSIADSGNDSLDSMHRFSTYDNQRTPTKLLCSLNMAHSGFPPLVNSARGGYRAASEQHASTSYFGFRAYGAFVPTSVPSTTDERTSENDMTGLSPPSPSSLDLTGDVRTVNMPALDQNPLRTWL
ncbi:hypothetical protein EG68_08847 [Paragonimus skrjabini miyazakii]|uniref:Uncharacterized protein n=1 Tax=Paragonimus skrjabini miyazakii TaxID=59628 RepID=A0A8S9YN45_9TREM|nr:hypothetical protein EG68_08847 [Paragonimus skrjabini miyazakii]